MHGVLVAHYEEKEREGKIQADLRITSNNKQTREREEKTKKKKTEEEEENRVLFSCIY